MIVLIRGGGDLASGVAVRLLRSGFNVVITELPAPLVVRRKVAFAEAVYQGQTQVEDFRAERIDNPEDTAWIMRVLDNFDVPVIVDQGMVALQYLQPEIVVDARMLKKQVPALPEFIQLVIGLGPGFATGENCHAVIETQRGHFLGRVIWHGSASHDTKIPEGVAGRYSERVLRAPESGVIASEVRIGDHLEAGDLIASVNEISVRAPFKGVLRGLVNPGQYVSRGMKIGDVDPRDDPRFCHLVSDKALAVGGGVLEAILSQPALRSKL